MVSTIMIMMMIIIIIVTYGLHHHKHDDAYLNPLCISEHKKQRQRVAVGVERVLRVKGRIVDVCFLKPGMIDFDDRFYGRF